MAKKITVRRKDIELQEQTIEESSLMTVETTRNAWVAVLDGYLSTGEFVSMSRTSQGHAGEALALLETAIKEEGWSIE